jgi:hypothetical protein
MADSAQQVYHTPRSQILWSKSLPTTAPFQATARLLV